MDSSEYLDYVDAISENLRLMRVLVAGALSLSENGFCASELEENPERQNWQLRGDMAAALYEIQKLVIAMQKAIPAI